MADAKIPKNPQKFNCIKCNYYSNNKKDYKKHIETQKHKMLTNADMDNRPIYKCECGKVYKQRQSLYRHKKSCPFKNNSNHTSNTIEMDKKWIKMDKCPKMSKIYKCECGKLYKYQSGLSKHKLKCNVNNNAMMLFTENTDQDLKVLVVDMMKKHTEVLEQNKELMEKCTELASKPTTINNTQFNVMNYLNTDCKDAMNLTDFINDFQFSLKDLDLLQSKGYQEAMERTFVKQLCDMDKTKRPIHCSDKKRKSFYVKDNDVWEKDEGNKKLIGSVQKLSSTHNRALSKWRSYNSDWSSNDKKQDFFNKSVQEFTKCDHEKERNKIFNKLVTLSIK